MSSTENLRTAINRTEKALSYMRVLLAQDGLNERTKANMTEVLQDVKEVKKEYNSVVPKQLQVK